MLLGIAKVVFVRFCGGYTLSASRRRYRKRYANFPYATRREFVPLGSTKKEKHRYGDLLQSRLPY